MVAVAYRRDENTGEALVEGTLRERRDRERFDVAVEGGVIVIERLVVRQIPRPSPVVQRDHQARTFRIASDPGRGLDVLGGGLGLADDDHRTEARHVNADGDHVGRQQQVDRSFVVWASRGAVRDEQLAQDRFDVPGGNP